MDDQHYISVLRTFRYPEDPESRFSKGSYEDHVSPKHVPSVLPIFKNIYICAYLIAITHFNVHETAKS